MKQKVSPKMAAYLEKTTPAERARDQAEFRRLSRSLSKRIDPAIHPDDAARAYLTRLTQRLRESNKTSRSIMEDEFLATRILKPIKEWTDGDWSTIRECAEETGDKFLQGLVDTRKKRRSREPLFDEMDIFILRNWRVGLCLGKLPPRIAVDKIRDADIASKATITATWFVQRRKRLGFAGHR